jgi:phosphoribosylanthranilate isomerase
VTGLFVNAVEASISEALARVPLGLLQFHGQERNGDCNRYGVPFIKSIAMQPGVDIDAVMAQYPDAAGFLLDAWQPATHGGSGAIFDWTQVPPGLSRPVVLAGGLTPDNVVAAIRATRPYAVDVSSGVETAKGIKSPDKINAFMKGVAHSETDAGR